MWVGERPAGSSQQTTPLAVVVAFLVVFILTYLSTSMWFELTLKNKASTLKPPIKPHWIPYLGNVFGLLFNPRGFFQSIWQYNSVPVHVKLGPEEMIIVSGSKNIQTIFSRSRDLSTKSLSLLVLMSCFGLPAKDAKIYEDDNSGILPKQQLGASVLPHKRVFHLTHRNFHYNLSGSPLEELSQQFVRFLAKGVVKMELACKHIWLEIPDLFEFIRNETFIATTTALCGEHILRLNPNMVDEFYTFDSWLPILTKKAPRWMVPKGFRARDKMHKNIMKWHEFAQEHLDPADESIKDVLWEPVWGAKVMRERGAFHNSIPEMSKEGYAADDLGMIWGANGNASLATAWAVFHVVSDKSLVARIREEITPAFSSASPASIELAKLNCCPLLQSVVAEILRLYVTVLIHRTSSIPDFKFGKWLIEPGKLMLASIYNAHHDDSKWNTGLRLADGRPQYSLDNFWAERFLEYPNDPLSGPAAKSPLQSISPNPTHKVEHNDKEAKYVTDKLKGVFIPWGGGTNMCPGQHYARNEIMVAVAMIVWAFEVEFVDEEEARKTKPSMAAFAISVLSPDRKVPIMLRKRQEVGNT